MSTTMTPDHPHNWAIAIPNGPTSTGICRTCGEQREFKNSLVPPNLYPPRKSMATLMAIRKAAAELERTVWPRD